MNIRKRIEQEMKLYPKAKMTSGRPVSMYNDGYVDALADVIRWMDEAKQSRKPRFVKPTLVELELAFSEKGVRGLDASSEACAFHDFYESKGWKVGNTKMVSWKHAVAGWVNRNKAKEEPKQAWIRDTSKDGYQPVFK